MRVTERKLEGVWWVLRVGLGVGILLTGLDKFFNLLATWSMYLSPTAERLLPVSGGAFLRGVGVLEAALGLAILTRWTRAGAYALAGWLLAIAVNLAVAGSFWDLVLRDTQNALASWALARLSEWREARPASAGLEGLRGGEPRS